MHARERSTSNDATNRIVPILSVSMSAYSSSMGLLSFSNFMASQIYSKLVLRSRRNQLKETVLSRSHSHLILEGNSRCCCSLLSNLLWSEHWQREQLKECKVGQSRTQGWSKIARRGSWKRLSIRLPPMWPLERCRMKYTVVEQSSFLLGDVIRSTTKNSALMFTKDLLDSSKAVILQCSLELEGELTDSCTLHQKQQNAAMLLGK